MELFVAFDLDQAAKAFLGRAATQMPAWQDCGGWRFEAIEKYHVTLLYLGKNRDAAPIIEALNRVALPRFTLTLGGVGTFDSPDWGVAWAGISGQMAQLHQLKEAVDQAMEGAGIPVPKRPYIPHVTLAFTPPKVLPDLEKGFMWPDEPFPPIPVDAFGLYAVADKADGQHFKLLHTFPLMP